MTEAMIAAILSQVEQLRSLKGELDSIEYDEAMEELLRDLLPARGLTISIPGGRCRRFCLRRIRR
jgi:hypothetical protein